MTKSQAQKALAGFLKTPADFLYLFATDSFVSKLSGVYRTTVYKKMRLQYKYINTLAIEAGGTFEEWRNQFKEAIISEYGDEPAKILNKLAAGENVAGKNWKEGVYGIGASYRDGFVNTQITVDKTTGKLLQNGQEIEGQTNVYQSNGTQIGYTVTVDGVQYQSQKVGNQYYAGTYGTSEGAFNADGTTYNPQNAMSIFQNIIGYLPMFDTLLNWLFSVSDTIKQRFNLMTAQTVATQQKDWIKTKDDKDTWLYFIAGAGILALLLR